MQISIQHFQKKKKIFCLEEKKSTTNLNAMTELFFTLLNDETLRKMSSFIFLEDVLNVETVY